MPPKSRRKGYWIEKKTYDDMEKKLEETRIEQAFMQGRQYEQDKNN